MIICDRAYLKELERRSKVARKQLPREVAAGIDAEIEAVEALGDAWYSLRVIAVAFRMSWQGLSCQCLVQPRTA